MFHDATVMESQIKTRIKKEIRSRTLFTFFHRVVILLISLLCIVTLYNVMLNTNAIHTTRTTTTASSSLENKQKLLKNNNDNTMSANEGVEKQNNNNLRILIAIINYESARTIVYLQDMIDNFYDLCNVVLTNTTKITTNNDKEELNMIKISKITIVIYTTFPYIQDILYKLNSRYQNTKISDNNNNCNFEIKIKIKSPIHGYNIVDFHREYFYNNINNYDLFLYTEDDLDIQAFHIISYWYEIMKLKNIVLDNTATTNNNNNSFQDYSIGFIRYEENLKSHQRTTFEHKNPALLPFLDFNGYVQTKIPHQGMFIATSEQLQLWKERCQFDNSAPKEITKNLKQNRHREFVSSLRLFMKRLPDGYGCNVQQLIPIDNFEDFMIHHKSNKFCCGSDSDSSNNNYYDTTNDIITNKNNENNDNNNKNPKMFFSSLELQRIRYNYLSMDNDDNAIPMFVDESEKDGIGRMYNGVKMSIIDSRDGSYNNINRTIWNEWMAAMNLYNDYAHNGGKLLFNNE